MSINTRVIVLVDKGVFSMELIFDESVLNRLNTPIRVDARRYGISNSQLVNLTNLYYQENGKQEPRDLIDLLRVIE